MHAGALPADYNVGFIKPYLSSNLFSRGPPPSLFVLPWTRWTTALLEVDSHDDRDALMEPWFFATTCIPSGSDSSIRRQPLMLVIALR